MKTLFNLLLFLFVTSIIGQQQKFETFTTSINSKYAELGIIYLNEYTVFFASSKKSENDKAFKKNRRKNNQQLYLDIYQANINPNGDLIQTNKFSNDINNKFFESDISFSPDQKTIYFTWNNFYNTQTRLDSAKWRTLQIMKADINNNFELSNIKHLPFNSKKYSVRSPMISKDGTKLFFVSDMPNGFGKNDIYVVEIKNDSIYGNPRNLGKNINTDKDELYPFIDENNTLYFSSYGHKGKGNLDIYKSLNKNGEYQKAENLGTPINSTYDDFAFVIDNSKNKGYFTSNRKGGKGDVDIYGFKLKDEECKQQVTSLFFNKNTGEPLTNVKVSLFSNNELVESKVISTKNSTSFSLKCEHDYTILAEKENFESAQVEFNTTNTINDSLIKNLQLTPIECKQQVTSLFFNKNTGEPVTNVKVSLVNNNELIESKIIRNENSTYFSLKCEQSYTILAEKEHYIPAEVQVKTNSELNANLEKSIALTPEKCTQILAGTIINKQTKKLIPNAIVTIFKDDVFLKTIKTNINAQYNFVLDCSNEYKILASAENYLDENVTIKTSNIYNDLLDKVLSLEPNAEIVTSRGQKMIKTETIYFDLDDDAIRKDAAIELNKVVNLLRNNPTIKIEIKSHTDSRAPDTYNLNLSERRASSVLNYITSKGIDSNRLSGRGYGETRLINKCSNGVKCTETQHQMNRRTEFVIIDE
jgi:outer membrane protein OmpA-like peptidoglycan-associated protein/5-hydroxyisourate hydrolase-like protein (transthyretin family)